MTSEPGTRTTTFLVTAIEREGALVTPEFDAEAIKNGLLNVFLEKEGYDFVVTQVTGQNDD